VLVTHGPPKGIHDKNFSGIQCGCQGLLNAVKKRKPLVHVFGHVHESHGFTKDDQSGVLFMNASTCNKFGKPNNPPLVFDIVL
jgi:Icc-related predicted phosphoesterase